MKTIHFSALDLDLEVPNIINYHDDGFVDSLEGRAAFLNWKYMGELDLSGKEQLDVTGNMLGTPAVHKEQHIHIYYRHRKYPENEIKTQGHEETHALRRIDYLLGNNAGMTAFLISVLNKKGVEINLPKLERKIRDTEVREEVIAELGGIFAVHQKYDLLTIGLPFVKEYCDIAANYYLDSYIKTRLKKIIPRKSLLERLIRF
ncbi:MAG: hypothetical protein WCI72_05795 [archaeon]